LLDYLDNILLFSTSKEVLENNFDIRRSSLFPLNYDWRVAYTTAYLSKKDDFFPNLPRSSLSEAVMIFTTPLRMSNPLFHLIFFINEKRSNVWEQKLKCSISLEIECNIKSYVTKYFIELEIINFVMVTF